MQSRIQQLPVTFMNEDHAHALVILDGLMDAVRACPEDLDSLGECLMEFISHSREHFEREEKAMQSSQFPPYPIHKSEHDRVLGWLEDTLTALRSNALDASQLNRIGEEMKSWFFQHIQSMDAVTANWIASHQHP